jgi:hypothetical protein
MQNSKHASYCLSIPTIRSEMVFRHSYPGNYPPSSDKEQIQKSQVDVEKLKRHPSNTSLSSHDSGVGFSKADYEIQRAIKAQRVQRPHIIVLHKGKPVSHTNNNNYNNNNYNNNNNNLVDNDEFEANIVVAAATASKRHRRDVQKRQTMISIGNNYTESLKRLSLLKNNSAPNLHQTILHKNIQHLKEQKENEEIKENREIKDESLKKQKSKLFKTVSISIKKFVGANKERRRQSLLIQQIHEQPRFF